MGLPLRRGGRAPRRPDAGRVRGARDHGRHRPAVWLSDRYSAQQGHADRQQTCLAHLARDIAYALDAGDDTLALRLKLWLDGVFALARTITTAALSTVLPSAESLSAPSTTSSPPRPSATWRLTSKAACAAPAICS